MWQLFFLAFMTIACFGAASEVERAQRHMVGLRWWAALILIAFFILAGAVCGLTAIHGILFY